LQPLSSFFCGAHPGATPTELRIDAEFATPYQTVANVLATAKRVRVEKIGFKSLAR